VPCQGGTTETRGSGRRDIVTLVDPGLVVNVTGNKVFVYVWYQCSSKTSAECGTIGTTGGLLYTR
jgi:hypothetical protein